MAGSVLKPIHVSAKVILSDTKVPALDGAPFDRGPEPLQKGIHVHWALPDSLTRATLLPARGKDVAVFPGVPDLWLVIRFNPGPPISQLGAKRTWQAWVVDSVAGKAVDLKSWTPPLGRDATQIHTVTGLLPQAATLGYPGYGAWNTDAQGAFDPAVAAYYPSSRHRFGFYDTVADLAGQKGNVSYVVIGWFADRGYDPLYMAEDRFGMLNDWKVLHHTRPNAFFEMGTMAPLTGGAPPPPKFDVGSISVTEQPAPSAAKRMDIAKASARGGTTSSQAMKLEAMQASFPKPPIGADMPVQASVDRCCYELGPKDTICHGSVVEVPLGGATTYPAPLVDEDIRLFPSVRRAMAEIAAMKVDATEQVDAVEMMLDDLESQKGSTSGVLDMPGTAHAMTFQGVPGKSQWFARMEIRPTSKLMEAKPYFDLGPIAFGQSVQSAGYWPQMMMRSASEIDAWMIQDIPPVSQYDPPPQLPQGPTDSEKEAWREQVRNALVDLAGPAEAAGTPIDPRLLKVVDKRKDAQPSTIGRTIGLGAASDGASWWIDTGVDAELDELLRSIDGGIVYMPHLDNLFEIPGPRWNRPWSPHLVLFGTGRSYKFGNDGRFRADGYMKSRMSGETATGFALGTYGPIHGQDLMDTPNALFSLAGIPAEARAIVSEALLLDTESTSVMAMLAGASRKAGGKLDAIEKQFKSAVRGLWLTRDETLSAKYRDQLDAIAGSGTFPSAIAISPWQDPRDPIFVDMNYSHPYSSLEENWTLGQDAVECVALDSSATNPPAGKVEEIEERSRVTAVTANVLKSTFVSRMTLDVQGHLVKAQTPPNGLTEDTFTKMDVLSAPLAAFDATLIDRGHRERSGALRVNRLELVDLFGLTRSWKSGVDPASSEGGPELPYWTELTPRLPYWSRLNFRLQSSTDLDAEASPLASPVCGILLPDFLEHALEVFDGEGNAIGQLTTDPPRFGSTDAVTLHVAFAVHPWVAAALNPPPANPVDAIANPILRSLVASLVAQTLDVPAGQPPSKWLETGLSAMLRCIDTVRATLDPSKRSDDRRVKLLGEPILVLPARLRWEGAATTNPSALAHDPPLLDAPPPLPVLSVRIGSPTRPDDGVLGCFLAGGTPGDGRFAPVAREAAEKAILNGLAFGVPSFASDDLAVTHPFVHDQEARFAVPANQDVDIVILADIRGGLYATCGTLPRKKIVMPREFIDAAVKSLEPTFRVGPILTTTAMAAVKALAPPPDIEGMETEYIYRQPGENGDPDSFPEVPVPHPAPAAELPKTQAILTDGWLRMRRAKP